MPPVRGGEAPRNNQAQVRAKERVAVIRRAVTILLLVVVGLVGVAAPAGSAVASERVAQGALEGGADFQDPEGGGNDGSKA